MPARVIDARLDRDAEELSRALLARLARIRAGDDVLRTPCCLIWAGELTVQVRGPGTGGRNQQLALAFALAIEGQVGVSLAALATDGIDGPTTAAGAIVDGETAGRIRAAGVDPAASLRENDAFFALQAASALVVTGYTGTNVNDLFLLWVDA